MVLPSTHVARDLAFRETIALCTALDARTAGAEDLEPELVDAPLFWDRVNTLLSGLVLKCFSLHGVTFRKGDAVDVHFFSAPYLQGLVVGACRFASSSAGVAADDGIHAGDLTVAFLSNGTEVGVFHERH